MQGKLTDADGQTVEATVDAVRERLSGDAFFWLDIEGLDADSSQLLLQGFGFHPLAVEDAEHFDQRPKVDDFDGFTYLVLHGALPSPGTPATCEVHVFFSAKHLVSVHHGDGGIFDGVRRRATRHRAAAGSSPAVSLLYLIVDELVDTYFPVLAQLDDRIDVLEDAILKQPTEAQLGELFAMKRTLVTLRKVVTPERDMFARLLSGMNLLEGMTPEDERYFRDLYDHLIRISDLVDSYRDLLTGAMDTHLSTVSNRLNVVIKQLTIIATVFLPLSFLTGFFGQNFGFLTGHVLTQTWSFWVLGVGLELVAAAGLLYLFRRRGWLGGPTE
ncbi:MAG: magnesium/cobalt transporter CorA [Candidatus Dormibacteria bacterium]